jgi:hypothetical protein
MYRAAVHSRRAYREAVCRDQIDTDIRHACTNRASQEVHGQQMVVLTGQMLFAPPSPRHPFLPHLDIHSSLTSTSIPPSPQHPFLPHLDIHSSLTSFLPHLNIHSSPQHPFLPHLNIPVDLGEGQAPLL